MCVCLDRCRSACRAKCTTASRLACSPTARHAGQALQAYRREPAVLPGEEAAVGAAAWPAHGCVKQVNKWICAACSKFTVAFSEDLTPLRQREWHYCTAELMELIPHTLRDKSLRKWLVSHFRQTALEVEQIVIDYDDFAEEEEDGNGLGVLSEREDDFIEDYEDDIDPGFGVQSPNNPAGFNAGLTASHHIKDVNSTNVSDGADACYAGGSKPNGKDSTYDATAKSRLHERDSTARVATILSSSRSLFKTPSPSQHAADTLDAVEQNQRPRDQSWQSPRPILEDTTGPNQDALADNRLVKSSSREFGMTDSVPVSSFMAARFYEAAGGTSWRYYFLVDLFLAVVLLNCLLLGLWFLPRQSQSKMTSVPVQSTYESLASLYHYFASNFSSNDFEGMPSSNSQDAHNSRCNSGQSGNGRGMHGNNIARVFA